MVWELKTKAFQRKAFLRGAVEYQEVSGAECGAAAGQKLFATWNFSIFTFAQFHLKKVKEDALVGP